MTQEEVVKLMESSRTPDEWNANCDKVKKACNGYPFFWFSAVVLSGLADRVLKAAGRPQGARMTVTTYNSDGSPARSES